MDRRADIAAAAIELVAVSGVRALTHRAVDRHLGLPDGSTSYYLRTRRALLTAAVRELAARARADFAASSPPAGRQPTPQQAADRIARALDQRLSARRSETVARWALALELADDAALHAELATAAYSRPLAVDLLASLGARDPERAGADLVSLCEGLVLDRVVGSRSLDAPAPGTPASVDHLRDAVLAQLRGALP